MEKRLRKSSREKKLCGVCGGIAEYFGIDPTIIRLIWVVLFFAYGVGVLAYIVAAIVMPEGTDYPNNYNKNDSGKNGPEF